MSEQGPEASTGMDAEAIMSDASGIDRRDLAKVIAYQTNFTDVRSFISAPVPCDLAQVPAIHRAFTENTQFYGEETETGWLEDPLFGSLVTQSKRFPGSETLARAIRARKAALAVGPLLLDAL